MDSPCSDTIDSLTEKVIGCGIEVHRALGPGLLESIYRDCMAIELTEQNLCVERDRHVRVTYKGQSVGGGLKLDLIVEGRSLRAGLKRLVHPDLYVKR